MTRSAAIETLGCKVNAFESELMGQSLVASGWRLTNPGDSADLYVINTCTVTREADRQARQTIRRVIRRNPEALVVVTGCYAQMDGESCADIPGVDLVLGNDRKLDIARYLPSLEEGTLPRVMVGDLNEHVSLPDQLVSGFEGKARAFVQVQQGCDQGCMFCIIHRARGPSRSLPMTLVRRQVERLLINGYREIVVCGVDLGAYGEDLPALVDGRRPTLELLLRELAALDGEFRIRLSSIDPAHISDGLVDLMAREARLCPHLHLSLQSGNSLVLRRMRRRYTAEHVLERIAGLRLAVPGLVLSADILVGYPNETEAQFLDTERMIEALGIAYPHVFPYSERDGTPAARIPAERQVPVSVRKERARLIRTAGERVRGTVLKEKVGKSVRVLVESRRAPATGPEHGGRSTGGAAGGSLWHARGADYLPVTLQADGIRAGEFYDTVVQGVDGDRLVARVAA